MKLEREFRCELNTPRPTASEERIADANVAGGGDGITAGACLQRVRPVQGKSVRRWIGDKCRQEWIRKIRMVHDIEEISPQLQIKPLSKNRVLINGKVPLFVSRAVQ